jgi:hypothetical protein
MNARHAVIASLLMSARPAAAAGTRSDSSDFLIWGFLGFCAIIIVAELIPLVPIIRKKMEKKTPEHAEAAVEARASTEDVPTTGSSH